MLWVDKYRPKTLDQAMVHQDIAQNLKKLVQFYLLQWLSIPNFQGFKVLASSCAGCRAGLPSFALLRAFRLRQENPNHRPYSSDFRTQRRQGRTFLIFFFSFVLHLRVRTISFGSEGLNYLFVCIWVLSVFTKCLPTDDMFEE